MKALSHEIILKLYVGMQHVIFEKEEAFSKSGLERGGDSV